MKKNKLIISALVLTIIVSVAVLATACNPTPAKYTLTFMAEGETLSSITAEAGSPVTPPTPPQKENKTFKGWYLNAEGTGEAVMLPNFMPSVNYIYYAVYTDINNPDSNKFTLTFIADGETFTTITEEAGAPVTPPTAPQKEFKTFKGWYLNGQGTGETVTLPNFMPAKNYTYYAVYEELPRPNDTFKEKDGDNILEIYGSELVFDFKSTKVRTQFSTGGDFADFEITDAQQKCTEYCVFLDYDEKTYSVFRYGASSDCYALYFPIDNSFNFERNLYFKENNVFEVISPTFSELNFGPVARGTYGPAGVSADEYMLNVEYVGNYFSFDVNRVKTKKIFRADSDNPNETLVYNAFLAYDENLVGDFSFYDAAYPKSRLSLDGYGYATYIDNEGIIKEGLVELAEVDVFTDTFVTFSSLDGSISELFLLMKNSSDSYFARIGDEIGIYRVLDVAQNIAGSYYILLNGFGELSLYFGGSLEYNPEILVAEGRYEIAYNGEFTCEIKNIIDESILGDAYKDSFTFKLTTFGEGLYVTKAFTLFDEDLHKEYADLDGTATLVLDGYGYGTYTQNGVVVLTGRLQVSDGLVLITADDENKALFSVVDGATKGTFKRIGLERGNYLLYSYVNGFDKRQLIFLDGDGNVKLFTYDKTGVTSEISNGNYSYTDTDGNYLIELDGKTFTAAFRQINFGEMYAPDWRYVYIVYDETKSGTLKNSANTESIVLDGYGLNAVYTNSKGKTFIGNYAWEWNILTILAYDENSDEYLFTFTVDGNIFEKGSNEAGVYYLYDPSLDSPLLSAKLLIDGNGNAKFSEFYDEEYLVESGKYTKDNYTEVYTVTFEIDGNTSVYNFKLVTRKGATYFVIFDEIWEGTYTSENGNDKLVLDGYGNVKYGSFSTNCTLMGHDLNVITFSADGTNYTFVLNRNKMTFNSASKKLGYYYPYGDGVINGYTRLFLGANGLAELYEYRESGESGYYALTATGVYSDLGNDVYTFTSENSETWNFKLSVIGNNRIYSLYIGSEGTYKHTSNVNGNEREFILTLDGYGNAEYTFFDKNDVKRTYTGFYTVAENGNITFSAVNYDYGYVYSTIVYKLDGNSFIILSQV